MKTLTRKRGVAVKNWLAAFGAMSARFARRKTFRALRCGAALLERGDLRGSAIIDFFTAQAEGNRTWR
jgi:hypothetical protein